MNPTYLIMIEDLLQYAKHIDYFNMTQRDFRQFYESIYDAVNNKIEVRPISRMKYSIGDSAEIYDSGHCPECNELLRDLENFCPNCGKALDWVAPNGSLYTEVI